MSDLERTLAFHLRAAKIPDPEREYRFHPTRRWRFDFCWPDHMLAVECEGGTWGKKKKSRHTTSSGFEKDCEKYNAAAMLGWSVMRFTSKMINNGSALSAIEATLIMKERHPEAKQCTHT